MMAENENGASGKRATSMPEKGANDKDVGNKPAGGMIQRQDHSSAKGNEDHPAPPLPQHATRNSKSRNHNAYAFPQQGCFVDPRFAVPISPIPAMWPPQPPQPPPPAQPLHPAMYYIQPEFGQCGPIMPQQQFFGIPMQPPGTSGECFDENAAGFIDPNACGGDIAGADCGGNFEAANGGMAANQTGDYQDMVPTEYYLRVIEAFKDSMVEVADVCRSVTRSNEMYAGKMCKLIESWIDDSPASQETHDRSRQQRDEKIAAVMETIPPRWRQQCANMIKLRYNYNFQPKQQQQQYQRPQGAFVPRGMTYRPRQSRDLSYHPPYQPNRYHQNHRTYAANLSTSSSSSSPPQATPTREDDSKHHLGDTGVPCEPGKKETSERVNFRDSIPVLMENKGLFAAYAILATESTDPAKAPRWGMGDDAKKKSDEPGEVAASAIAPSEITPSISECCGGSESTTTSAGDATTTFSQKTEIESTEKKGGGGGAASVDEEAEENDFNISNWGDLSVEMCDDRSHEMGCTTERKPVSITDESRGPQGAADSNDRSPRRIPLRYNIFAWKTRPLFDIETDEAASKASIVRKLMSYGKAVTVSDVSKTLEDMIGYKGDASVMDATRCLLWLAMNGVITFSGGKWMELCSL
jgi:hypothetical protein